MKRPLYIFLFLTLLFSPHLNGQIQGLNITSNNKKGEVPFEYINNFIVVNATFNKILPLRFIFDTGAEYTILNKREIADGMGLVYEKEFRVLGSDMSTELVAYLIRDNQLDMEGMQVKQADLLVLEEDYFRFEEFAGIEVHGIIGANFFKHLLVGIDYKRKVLTFQYPNPNRTKEITKGYQQIPVHTFKNKIYIHTHVQVNPDTILQLSLLMDTGAAIATLLHTHSHTELDLPDNTIEGNVAMGLGGFLKGYLGRIHRLELGVFSFDNILTSFQEITSQQDTSQLFGRHGIIGNVLLSRFKIIIDYPHAKLYVKPIKKYNKGFKYDKSGLGIIATGVDLNRFEVSHVIAGSPADQVGIQQGDVITKVNFLTSSFYSLPDIIRMLQKKEGKKIKMVVRRNGERMKFRFRLRKLI